MRVVAKIGTSSITDDLGAIARTSVRKVTAEVVKIAHAAGVSVEGELGCLGNLETGAGEKEDGHGFEGKLTRDELLTDPDQALDFVSKTGVDALAVAIEPADGEKCERCWNYSTRVGEFEKYPTVCERCSAALDEIVAGN